VASSLFSRRLVHEQVDPGTEWLPIVEYSVEIQNKGAPKKQFAFTSITSVSTSLSLLADTIMLNNKKINHIFISA
jgi:hypothetical protein